MQFARLGTPMERLATDISCEVPETGNQHILVVSDNFTKWAEAFALPAIETEIVARTIMEYKWLSVMVCTHSVQGGSPVRTHARMAEEHNLIYPEYVTCPGHH